MASLEKICSRPQSLVLVISCLLFSPGQAHSLQLKFLVNATLRLQTWLKFSTPIAYESHFPQISFFFFFHFILNVARWLPLETNIKGTILCFLSNYFSISVVKPVKHSINTRQLVWPLPSIAHVSLLRCAAFVVLYFLAVVSNEAWDHHVTVNRGFLKHFKIRSWGISVLQVVMVWVK